MKHNSRSPRKLTVFRPAVLILVSILAGVLWSCSTEFSPNAPFNEQLVVYAVLDASAAYQTVRIESTYEATSINEASRIVKSALDSAVVVIRSGGKTYEFYDTLIASSSGTQRRVWISRKLFPQPQAAYHLSVRVPGFPELSSDVIMPYRSYLDIVQLTTSADSNAVQISAIDAQLNAVKQAFYFRMWITGERTENGVTVELRREVPFRYDGATGTSVYPSLSYATRAIFPIVNLERIRSLLMYQDSAFGSNIVAVAYAMDQNLYTYCKLVNGFQDPRSVQLNAPDFTNIKNGRGLFGGLWPDSIRRGYTDVVFHTAPGQ